MPNCSRCGKQTCMGNCWSGSCKSCGSWTCKGNCGRVVNMSTTSRCSVCGQTYFGGHVCMKKK